MTEQNLLIILGNQLFPLEEISKINSNTVFMKEDYNFCTDFKHHKLKILMFFLAMRDYRDCLKKKGYNVIGISRTSDDINFDFSKSENIKSLYFDKIKKKT